MRKVLHCREEKCELCMSRNRAMRRIALVRPADLHFVFEKLGFFVTKNCDEILFFKKRLIQLLNFWRWVIWGWSKSKIAIVYACWSAGKNWQGMLGTCFCYCFWLLKILNVKIPWYSVITSLKCISKSQHIPFVWKNNFDVELQINNSYKFLKFMILFNTASNSYWENKNFFLQ